MEGHPKGEVNFFGSKAMQTIAKAERDYFVKIQESYKSELRVDTVAFHPTFCWKRCKA